MPVWVALYGEPSCKNCALFLTEKLEAFPVFAAFHCKGPTHPPCNELSAAWPLCGACNSIGAHVSVFDGNAGHLERRWDRGVQSSRSDEGYTGKSVLPRVHSSIGTNRRMAQVVN